ncbi:MAG: hypothetical protein SFX72_08775 [Isosphaeraceae bacterium]|nr:hypothetical protein [Isosphaeraceae bacterium]
MFISPKRDGEAFVYSVVGRSLDCAITRSLRRELLYGNIPILPLIIDLEMVEFADSSGIGLLCQLHECLGEAVVLAKCGRRLSAILDKYPRTRMPRRYPTLEEAEESLSHASRGTSARAMLTDSAPLHARSTPFDHWYVKSEVPANGSDR